MAKLIDANEAKEVLIDYYHIRTNIQQMSMEEAFSRVPTVEAIPVEWIMSKIDAILDSYPDGNEETEILCKLLYEWVKENGRSE